MPEFSTTSAFLRASDLAEGEDTIVTIRSFTEESLRQDERTVKKWVLKFYEREEGLPLNKGNGEVISKLYGREMDNWVGKQIGLYVDPSITYNGAQVSGIRVRPHNGF